MPDAASYSNPGGTTAPGGSAGMVQVNLAGAFAGDANLTWDNTHKRLGVGTATPVQAIDAGAGLVTGGTNSATFRNLLDLSSNPTFAAVDFTFPGTGVFRAAEANILGTKDVFFQGLPVGTGYTYLEGSGLGLAVGTYGSIPVLVRPNRVTTVQFPVAGGISIVLQIADSAAANGTLYYSTTASKLCWKDFAGVVHPIA